MLTETALATIRGHLMTMFSYATYLAGETWHQAEIQSAAILESGDISVAILIDTTETGEDAVTEVRLYGGAEALLASETVNILRTEALEGILFRFSFRVSEAQEG